MSIFDKIEPDDILLQKYEFCHEKEGCRLKPIQFRWDNFEDTYLNINLCWKHFAWNRVSLNYKYNINIKQLSKEPWLRALNQELHFNHIKTLVFRGETYYNAYDLHRFHENYGLMVVWRYCKRNKIHLDGYEKIVLSNNEGTESYEYIQRTKH